MLQIYEAIWLGEDENGELRVHSYLAASSYLARRHCGAPEGAEVTVRVRYVLTNG
jgi:hypothetical protein